MALQPLSPLAIVIPAYRIRYLGEALDSIARQTDKQFQVYVGDDASPEPLAALVKGFQSAVNITYHRFPQNLGGRNLVAHWHRCVALTVSEPWIWLFSDDDVMESDCVESFFRELRSSADAPSDLYRFQLDYIDERSRRYFRPADHPVFETAEALMVALLTDRGRAWRAQDHVFARRIFEQHRGFVDFPKAIYSDHATWLEYSAAKGVRTIRGSRVLWRSHGSGTSSGMRQTNRAEWQDAAKLYVEWLDNFSREQGLRASARFRSLGRHFYFNELSRFRPVLSATERKAAVSFAQRLFGGSRVEITLELYHRLVAYRLSQCRSRRWFKR
jgi:glycosyltransferase involved in cell wall biosynthesis